MQTHQSDPRVLNRRTLERDHRVLAARLRPGMTVLDVGCGTGAITAGIARAVGPEGLVIGLDRDESLLQIARTDHPDLQFECGDLLSVTDEHRFDIVSAARVLQWVREPSVTALARALKPGGRLVALDYNHADNAWHPEPPPQFQRFYQAFLDWREANGWDNHMADHLAQIFADAGLSTIETHDSSEIVRRGDTDFTGATAIWPHVIQSLGPKFHDIADLAESYTAWAATTLQTQTLSMKTIEGLM